MQEVPGEGEEPRACPLAPVRKKGELCPQSVYMATCRESRGHLESDRVVIVGSPTGQAWAPQGLGASLGLGCPVLGAVSLDADPTVNKEGTEACGLGTLGLGDVSPPGQWGHGVREGVGSMTTFPPALVPICAGSCC